MARSLALLLMKNEAALHSQHIAGKHNIVADSLSRDHHIYDNILTSVLSCLYTTQAPNSFKMQSLSNKVISWVYLLKDMSTNRKEYILTTTPSTTSALIAGDDSYKHVKLPMNFLKNSHKRNGSGWCQHSQQVLERMS